MSRSGPPTALSAQRAVQDSWTEVLGTTAPDLDTPFADFGGDSVTLVALSSVIRRRCGVCLDLPALFSATTVRQQAALVEQLAVRETSRESRTDSAPTSPYPASAAQTEWLARELRDPASPANWTAISLPLPPVATIESLQGRVDALIQTWDVFRLALTPHPDGSVTADPIDAARARVEVGLLEGDDGRHPLASLQPPDIQSGPLMSVAYGRCDDGAPSLHLLTHQAVLDAPSTAVIVDILRGGAPEQHVRSYRAYAEWEAGPRGQAVVREDIAHWASRLAGFAAGPTGPNGAQGGWSTTISAATILRLGQLARRHRVSLRCLVILAAAVAARSEGSDVTTVAVPVSGRPDAGWMRSVGCFQNTVVLPLTVGSGDALAPLLHDVARAYRDAHVHQLARPRALAEELGVAELRADVAVHVHEREWFGPLVTRRTLAQFAANYRSVASRWSWFVAPHGEGDWPSAVAGLPVTEARRVTAHLGVMLDRLAATGLDETVADLATAPGGDRR